MTDRELPLVAANPRRDIEPLRQTKCWRLWKKMILQSAAARIGTTGSPVDRRQRGRINDPDRHRKQIWPRYRGIGG